MFSSVNFSSLPAVSPRKMDIEPLRDYIECTAQPQPREKMPLPIAPLAGFALRYGAIAMATYAATRTVERGFRDQRAEDALDELDEGLTMRREPGQTNATGRYRRVIRLGADGPGVEIDLTALGRLRLRRV